MATELATAYVSIVPSARGFGRKLSQELDGAGFDAAGKRAGDSGAEGFSTAFKSGMAAAGVAAALVLAKSFTDALDLGKANDKFAAQLGLPPARAKELGEVAGNLYANAYGESVVEVNDALRGVLQSGLVTEDVDNGVLEDLTAKALDLAAAFDVDVNQATATAGQLMRTGLATDADEAFDIITRGFQEGADKSGDLLDTFTEYGTQFRKLGIDGAEATGLLVQGLEAGARDADIVADAIKEFSIRAVDGSELTADGFERIGLNAADMAAAIAKGGPEANDALDETLDRLRAIEDPVERSQVAVALFGTQAEDLGDALFALDLDTAAEGLGNIEGAAARMGDTLNDNASTKIEAFKRQALGGLTEFIGSTVIPGVESLARVFEEEGLGGVIDRVGDRFQQALPRIGEALSTLGTNIVTFIQEQGPVLAEKLGILAQELVAWIAPQIPPLLGELTKFIGEIAVWILEEGLPALAEYAAELAPALIDWIVDEAIPGFLEAIPDFLEAFDDWLTDDAVPAFIEGGKDLAFALAKGFRDSLSEAFEGVIPGGGDFNFDLGGLELSIPGLASGGRVSAGEAYVVGERRPELFVPDSAGTILPSVPNALGGSGFRDLHVHGDLGEDPIERAVREQRRIQLMSAA
jgi:hypothetical protein